MKPFRARAWYMCAEDPWNRPLQSYWERAWADHIRRMKEAPRVG